MTATHHLAIRDLAQQQTEPQCIVRRDPASRGISLESKAAGVGRFLPVSHSPQPGSLLHRTKSLQTTHCGHSSPCAINGRYLRKAAVLPIGWNCSVASSVKDLHVVDEGFLDRVITVAGKANPEIRVVVRARGQVDRGESPHRIGRRFDQLPALAVVPLDIE